MFCEAYVFQKASKLDLKSGTGSKKHTCDRLVGDFFPFRWENFHFKIVGLHPNKHKGNDQNDVIGYVLMGAF